MLSLLKKLVKLLLANYYKLPRIITNDIRTNSQIIHNNSRSKGLGLVLIIVFMSIFLFLGGGTLHWVGLQNKASIQRAQEESAFQIAEAGINYYRWHLAHDNDDYQDGTGGPGPYIHDYKDVSGNTIGQFSLEIDPPPVGSTVATIKSTGYLLANPNLKRKITSRVGIPSYAEYSFLTNTDVWFGDTEHVSGKMHANGGIRFDGTCDSIISSAKETYICKSHHGCGNKEKPGIWGDGGPQGFWRFPVPAVDFNVITVNLAEIKSGAQNQGVYLAPSGAYGWHIRFKSNGTFDLYKVTKLQNLRWGYSTHQGWILSSDDIKTEVFQQNYSIPTNGLIFVEDKLWVDGTVRGRVTVGSGRFPVNPDTYTTIVIPNNLVYTTKDGSDVIGLIAQKDILIPRFSPNVMEIHGALIAQNGATQRYYYPGNILDKLTTYGSLISNQVWTWSWVSGGGAIVSGYRNTYTTYDTNLIYAPPPSFPKKEEYEVLSWEEN